MGILDKAKAAATKAAEAAQKGASQVQGKVEHAQTRRKADDLAKQLGYLVVRERSGGEPAGAEADDLVTRIKALEERLASEPAPETTGDGAGADEAASPATAEPGPGDAKAD